MTCTCMPIGGKLSKLRAGILSTLTRTCIYINKGNTQYLIYNVYESPSIMFIFISTGGQFDKFKSQSDY
jgi:hypothetical protein